MRLSRSSSDINIGDPKQVKHQFHVVQSDRSKSGFFGMPSDWERKLLCNGVTADDMEAYPNEAMGAIQFLTNKPKPLPSRIDVEDQEMPDLIEDTPTNYFVL